MLILANLLNTSDVKDKVFFLRTLPLSFPPFFLFFFLSCLPFCSLALLLCCFQEAFPGFVVVIGNTRAMVLQVEAHNLNQG